MGWDGIVFELARAQSLAIDLGRYRWYGVLDRGRESVPSTQAWID